MGKGAGDDNCRQAIQFGGRAGGDQTAVAPDMSYFFGLPADETFAWSIWDTSLPHGRVMPDGVVYDVNSEFMGIISPQGAVHNYMDEYVGQVLPDGRFFNAFNEYKGRMNEIGEVFDLAGEYVGWVDPPNLFAASVLVFRYMPGKNQEF